MKNQPTDRQLLEQLVTSVGVIQRDITDLKEGQVALQEKVDFIAEQDDKRFNEVDDRFDKVDDRFDVLTKNVNKRFDENSNEHAVMNKTLTEHTGNEVELGIKYDKLDQERKVMVHRQDRLEKVLHS